MVEAISTYIFLMVGVGIFIRLIAKPIVCKGIYKNKKPKEINYKHVYKIVNVTMIIYIIIAIVAGFFVVPTLQRYFEQKEALLSECERNGCQIKYEKYHNVFEERWDVIEVLKDTESEEEISGRNLIGFDKEKAVYQFFCEQKDSARKWETIPTDATKLYPIVESESAYVEKWRQYGEYRCCSVCGGNESYKWTVPFYKIYYVEGDIVEEKTIPQE